MLDDAAFAQREKNVQGATPARYPHGILEPKVRELPLRLLCTGCISLHSIAYRCASPAPVLP